ncbi:HEPN domain-containing protein [Rufibacter sp. XAAS-G3-1]|uniref:HEPN domain-containing protein n=1 Tax=Rufibacter sp. XAAS-G3-1 TaxID=2729134 RepID=UPI0015E77251|nr:HEPN domain-containing protein [Rufibacter sp. XAAS-G3-1]
MSFKWGEFLETARLLAQGSKESEYRCSIGRSYYAVYHTLKKHFPFQDSSPSAHRGFYNHLQRNDDNWIVVAIGKKLQELYDNRHHADYKDFPEIKQHAAEGALRTAEDILKKLDAYLKEDEE